MSDAWISSPFCNDCLESISFLVTARNLPPYFGIVGVSEETAVIPGDCLESASLLCVNDLFGFCLE